MTALTTKGDTSIDIKAADGKDLVVWFNLNSGSKNPIKKFKDRATAEARCAELKQALIELSGGSSKTGATAKAKGKSATEKKGGEESKGTVGRKSENVGKFIFRLVKENPRREGTHGHKAFAVIKDGMLYEDYVAAVAKLDIPDSAKGPKHLLWDIAHKSVELRTSKK